MNLLVPVLTTWLGATAGYVAANLTYWLVFCLPCAVWLVGGHVANLGALYGAGACGHRLWHLCAFLPAVVVGIVAFVPIMHGLSAAVLLVALVYAVINGAVEELFWRGMYLRVFGDSKPALALSWSLFCMWHVALALAKGITYHGGAAALMAGAAFMGLLWSAVACKTQTIRYVTLAHILANFFAFSELIAANGFL